MQDKVQSSDSADFANNSTDNSAESSADSVNTRMQIVLHTIDALWQDGKSIKVKAFSKKHIFNNFPLIPCSTKLGWIKLSGKKQGIAIGMFSRDCKRFRQLAVADLEGRVYEGNTITIEDAIESIPELSFIEQNSMTLIDANRFYGFNNKKTIHASHSPVSYTHLTLPTTERV